MWPFKKKDTTETSEKTASAAAVNPSVADGIDWRQILSEGKSVELFDGCRAKCDGTFEDL